MKSAKPSLLLLRLINSLRPIRLIFRRTDGQPVPNAEEIQLLEKAANNIVRIAGSSDDELLFESSGAYSQRRTGFRRARKRL